MIEQPSQDEEVKNEESKPKEPSDSLITDEPVIDFSKRPEDFPDAYWDAEKNAPNVDQLYKDFLNRDKIAKDLRVKLSKGEFTGVPPKDASEYTLDLAEELQPLVPDDDPMVDAARNAALEAGMTNEQFGKFMPTVVQALAELRAQAEAPPTEEQLEAQRLQAEEARKAEIEKLGPSGGKIVAAINDFRLSLVADGTLSEEEGEAMRNMVFDAQSAKVMNKLRARRGERDNIPLSVPVDEASSRKDIEDKMAKAFAERNEVEFQKYSSMLAKLS